MWDEPHVKLKCQKLKTQGTQKGCRFIETEDGGHGSWISAKKCVTTYLPNESVPKMDDAKVFY